MCEQDLELTPPILPDRANLCGRGHPKIDQFHTKSHYLFLRTLKVFINALKMLVNNKSLM